MNRIEPTPCLAACAALLASAAIAAPLEWTFPRVTSCHEGLAFADGVTGVLVWGGGDTINLTVGRADLWDHRGGYPWTEAQSYTNIVALCRARREADLRALFVSEHPANWGGRYNPYMLPLGRVTVRIPGATLKSGTLDPTTGLGTLTLVDGRKLELAMSHAARAFAIRFPKGVSCETRVTHAADLSKLLADTFRKRGFASAVPWQTGADTFGFDWTLPADKPVTLAAARRGDRLVVATARAARPDFAKIADFDTLRGDSLRHWAAFWREGARIRVPDPVLQRVYDYGMYRFGAMTEPDGVPAGLQGPWLEDDRLVPWSGDYHFNINVQQCYSPAFRGGHFAHLLPMFRMVLSWRPLLRENARKFVGIDNGYVLPHSVDDRGVCIGGFWTGTIDHASAAWMAALMFRYVRYSRDTAFLRNGAYDFMKGAMNVYRAMMEEREGRLSLPLLPSPEWHGDSLEKAVGRDPSFQLAAARRLAADLGEAAALLGEKPDPMWRDVLARLPSYVADPKTGINLFEGQTFNETHRHHSHLAGFYPFDTIDFASARKSGLVEKSYATWVRQGTGLWSGWCVPWAAILNVHFESPRGAVARLHDWAEYFCDEGYGSHHDSWNPGFSTLRWNRLVMQMDGQCAAVTAVLELLAHEWNGKVEFFRGCPESWRDVSFENLALADGTRANGRRLDGKVTVERVGAR